ncbi:MAG TPA: hypothetical protein VFB07_12375 [Vicinamibacterales bacterium]|nr:hypothetical protein [Vicinamibacterales bacterium]
MTSSDRELWRSGDVCCWMISCCSGAELQLRRGDDIILRELYPTKSDLYERAAMLRREHEPHQQR